VAIFGGDWCIFLIWNARLEAVLEDLGGKFFVGFLRNSTKKPLCVFTGRSLLQYYRVVRWLPHAFCFVGAGIIVPEIPLELFLGSKLEPLLPACVSSNFGFSFKIEAFSLPLYCSGFFWGRRSLRANERYYFLHSKL